MMVSLTMNSNLVKNTNEWKTNASQIIWRLQRSLTQTSKLLRKIDRRALMTWSKWNAKETKTLLKNRSGCMPMTWIQGEQTEANQSSTSSNMGSNQRSSRTRKVRWIQYIWSKSRKLMLGSNLRTISKLISRKNIRMMEVGGKRRSRSLNLLRSQAISELRHISLGHPPIMVAARGRGLLALKPMPASALARQGQCLTETAWLLPRSASIASPSAFAWSQPWLWQRSSYFTSDLEQRLNAKEMFLRFFFHRNSQIATTLGPAASQWKSRPLLLSVRWGYAKASSKSTTWRTMTAKARALQRIELQQLNQRYTLKSIEICWAKNSWIEEYRIRPPSRQTRSWVKAKRTILRTSTLRISRNLSKETIKKNYQQILQKKRSSKQKHGDHHNSWSHRSRSWKVKPLNNGWLRPKRTQIHFKMSRSSRTWAHWIKICSMKTPIVRIWIKTTIRRYTTTHSHRTKTRASKYPTPTRTPCKGATTRRFLLRTTSCSFHNFSSRPSWAAKDSICPNQCTSSLLEHSTTTTTTALLSASSKTQPSCIQCTHLNHQRTTSTTSTTTATRYSKWPRTALPPQARAQAKRVS